jgi:hypothetical protein
VDAIRLLFVASNPAGSQPLRLDHDLDGLHRGLETTRSSERFHIKTLWEPTQGDILDGLNAFKPHIFHFSGHGLRQGGLLVSSRNDETGLLRDESLLRTFRAIAGQSAPRLVVLACCWSLAMARETSRFVDCALGVSHEVEDRTAWEFIQGFYGGLGAGRSVDAAHQLGLARVSSKVDLHHTFWLENRNDVDARKVSFDGASGGKPKLAEASRLLDASLYLDAARELEVYLAREPSDGYGWTLLVLAKLGLRRPAEFVGLGEVRKLLKLLDLAARQGASSPSQAADLHGSILLLRAWIQEDFLDRYVLDCPESRSMALLMRELAAAPLDREMLLRLWRLMPEEKEGLQLPAFVAGKLF